MSDTTTQKTFTQTIVDWMKSPNGVMVITACFAPSGVAGLKLARWFGLDTTQLGWITNEIIQFGPILVPVIINRIQSTHAAIIAMAANILAKHQMGSIIINANATDGAAQAAKDPMLPNVVAAGTQEARQAATGA